MIGKILPPLKINLNYLIVIIIKECHKLNFYSKLEWAASNGNRYPPYPQLMATAISQ